MIRTLLLLGSGGGFVQHAPPTSQSRIDRLRSASCPTLSRRGAVGGELLKIVLHRRGMHR
jgi:hypothetical protein